MGTVLPSYLLVLLFHFSPIRKTAPLSFVPPRQLSHTAQVPTRHSLGASSNQEDSFVAATAMKKRTIKAVLFDMDGTLLDTETLSDKAVFQTFGDSLPPSVAQTHNHRLPWEIKEPTLGLQGHAWIPLVLQYAHDNWGVAVKKGEESDLPPAPSVYVLCAMAGNLRRGGLLESLSPTHTAFSFFARGKTGLNFGKGGRPHSTVFVPTLKLVLVLPSS